MSQKQSLRVLDNMEFAQEKVSSDATLFAQFAMAEARRNSLHTREVVDELQTKGEKKIIIL